MSLLVLAFPNIDKKDFQWIQSIREKYDEKYFNIVEPHFTLVFPLSELSINELSRHVKSISKKFGVFYFVLRCAQIVKDSFSDYTDVFLIPEEGYRIFVKLHDALYTGPIEKDLRLDIPFIPHIGIANNLDPKFCKKIADEINSKNLEIVGEINKLSIVDYDNDKVSIIEDIYLRK